MKRSPRLLAAIAAVAAFSVGQVSQAATYVWTGGTGFSAGTVAAGDETFGSGTAWNDPANWVNSAGGAVTDFPDDLTDIALINRTGTVAYNGSLVPTVQTASATALTVGEIHSGSWFATQVSLQLQNNLSVNVLDQELHTGAGHTNTFNGKTLNVVGTGASVLQLLAGGAAINVGNAPLNFKGSGTLSVGYIPAYSWGLTTLGDSADDNITVAGAGNNAFFNNGIAFGPGTVNFTGQMISRGGPTYTIAPGGVVTGTLGNLSIGLRFDYGGSNIGAGVMGAQLNINAFAGGWTHSLEGNATLGALYLGPEVGANDTVDVTANNYTLTVLNDTQVGKPGIVPHPVFGGFGTLQLRSATANFNNLKLTGEVGKMLATNATINVAGNFDSSVADTNGNFPTISIGTSTFHFTGIGKTLKVAAPHNFYNVQFDGSTTLLSDLNVNNSIKVTGTATGDATIDLNLLTGADFSFDPGLFDIGGILTADNGSVIEMPGGSLYLGNLTLLGNAYVDFFNDHSGRLRLDGDQQSYLLGLIASDAIRGMDPTGPDGKGFTLLFDGENTLLFVPEPASVAMLLLAPLAMLRRRRRA